MTEGRESKKHRSRYLKTVLILSVLIIVSALTALSHSFCDRYTDVVYPVLCDAISHVTGPVPFAVGEILMYIGALMIPASVLFLLLLVFLRKKAGYRRFCKGYFKTFSIILLVVVLVYIPTWFIPFCGTVLGRGNMKLRTEFTYEEVYDLLLFAAEGANAAAEEIYIAEDGSVEFYTSEKNSELAAKAMKDLGDEFGRLRGYYPPVKTAICSDILERMWIGGYNYPYTMEPTHNRYLSPLYQLSLDAHEYAHHKGYEKENEANFLSYLACSRSDDPYLRLSGYWEMYDQLYGAYIDARDEMIDQLIAEGKIVWPEKIESEEDLMQIGAILKQYFNDEPVLSERANMIYEAGNNIEREIYEADTHVIDELPAVDEAIRETADTGWSVQGEILKENTYDGVVLLLLQYYYPETEK